MTVIFHIDVNSAFLSWSAAEKKADETHPDLRTIPSIIGGDEASRHGIVLAKSTPAKACGIHTGEPVASALRKCPFLVIEPPDHKLYKKRSQELMELLHTYTSDLEQLSIDESFMDFGPIAHRFSSPEEGAVTIKNHIRDQLGFTVNVGISSNRVLAKMASDFQKPDRVHTLFPDEIKRKMWPLPVEELYMVGQSSSARLHQLGLHTIGDLAAADPAFLISQFKSHGRQMWEYANGRDSDRIVSEKQELKCVGNSITLSQDAANREEAKKVLLSLAETVSGRLRNYDLLAQTVTVELKYSSFTSVSHQTLLRTPSNTTQQLYDTACTLFDELWDGSPIRLLGIRTSKLQNKSEPVQLSIFDLDFSTLQPEKKPAPSHEKQQKLEQAMDTIRSRYGPGAVVRGSFLKNPDQFKPPKERG